MIQTNIPTTIIPPTTLPNIIPCYGVSGLKFVEFLFELSRQAFEKEHWNEE